MSSKVRHVRQGDTEPIHIVVEATGLDDLSTLSTATIYLREENAASNFVDGASLSVASSAQKRLAFDPVSAAVGSVDATSVVGTYKGYVLLTFTDGDTSRHPAKEFLILKVTPNYE